MVFLAILKVLEPRVEKAVFVVFEKVTHDYTARFVSDLAGNPEDRVSHNEAHIRLELESRAILSLY